MKKITKLLLVLSITLAACEGGNTVSKKIEIPDNKETYLNGAWVGSDSIRRTGVVVVDIVNSSQKDSVTHKNYLITDTVCSYFFKVNVPLLDSVTKKPLLDSLHMPIQKEEWRRQILSHKQDSLLLYLDGKNMDSLIKIKGKF